MSRRHNFQTVSWFYDIAQRDLLDLNPPYQRRSVWNQEFKDYFVDTVLLNYPAPAIFLFEDISSDGRSVYHVVDGKQRLTTLLEFIRGDFPVRDKSNVAAAKGKYFKNLDDALKKQVWSYQFLVEYVPTDDEEIINGIFDRINRNVAKLTQQELRHARLDGEFISAAEDQAQWMEEVLPPNMPRFLSQSKKQMKDVEFVALLLLLIEEGPKGYSQELLDEAFSSRDSEWELKHQTIGSFQRAIAALEQIIRSSVDPKELFASRLRNQADFYSLIGAVHGLLEEGALVQPDEASRRLVQFLNRVDSEAERLKDPELMGYYDAARSASNDRGPRERRIQYLRQLLSA
ncbi:DUF262 domain-containing protein [Lysobacter sp. A6]|uniref:DUF262 domain-containing protein n=1 Tax=Noviluteimonas lactosilytica TaxID=2888523 RepID=A0ABS8JI35_9GAMM|nr:DUF262 domain-containing protein [Lysobacter lactosilyticus]MCC8363269.1 DUF262 domain-containing protein [Lysobacter lactosilyticus]